MISIVYFIVYLLFFIFYTKKNGKCVGSWLLLWYTIAAALTMWEFYTTPINSTYLDLKATIYFLLCQIISLYPFLLLGKYDCRNFQYSESLFSYLGYILIGFGIYKLIYSSIDLYGNIEFLLGDMAQIRYAFYDNFLNKHNISSFEKLTIIVNKIQYMSPFLAFYFLCKRKIKMAIWLFIASLGMPVGQMVHGEREGSLKYIVNIYFCYLFFSSVLSDDLRNKIKKIGYIVVFPFLLFIIAMTFSRFGKGFDGGLLHSIFLYGGDQPFFFTALFNDNNIINQLQDGRVNFQYFFPVKERVQGQINLFVDSDIYLNQFGGMPGSFFLDFGYNTIFIIALFTIIYLFLIRNAKLIADCIYPIHILFLFYFSFQVLYMNIFYFDFFDLFGVLFTLVFFVVCYFYRGPVELLNRIEK